MQSVSFILRHSMGGSKCPSIRSLHFAFDPSCLRHVRSVLSARPRWCVFVLLPPRWCSPPALA
eukprot:scaffold1257_cov311-Pavlova_lutheri.AAC.2